jgi:hypothetical protein
MWFFIFQYGVQNFSSSIFFCVKFLTFQQIQNQHQNSVFFMPMQTRRKTKKRIQQLFLRSKYASSFSCSGLLCTEM